MPPKGCYYYIVVFCKLYGYYNIGPKEEEQKEEND
jgi:hypothetical protein